MISKALYKKTRRMNEILLNISKKLKTPYVVGYPKVLMIEPTIECNLDCPLCSCGKKNIIIRDKKSLSFKDFKKIINEMYLFSDVIYLWNRGEPLINEDLIKMIKYAKKFSFEVILSTNGTLISEGMAKELVKSKLDTIIIGMDGITQLSYEKFRKGGKLFDVKNGIQKLRYWKNKNNIKTPFIEVQLIVTSYNEKQVNEFKRLGLKLGGNDTSLKTLRLNLENNDSLEKEMEYLPKNINYSRYLTSNGKLINKEKGYSDFCERSWYHSLILCDGTVSACCYDDAKIYSFGNIKVSGIKKIWNNKAP